MTFDEIVAGGEAWLNEALRTEMQEGLTLDFKGSAAGKPGAVFTADGKLTRDGRSSIGQALSAFSNSAGGLVVLGVDCRENDVGVDCAAVLDPVQNWRAALSALSSAVGDLLQPKNDGIRIDGFAATANNKSGYLVIDVPRSDRRPHRCEASGQKQYFKRSGSATYAMEHVDIEDAFRRVSAPILSVTHRFARRSRSGLTQNISIAVLLFNDGLVSASDPSITLFDFSGVRKQSANCADQMNEDRSDGRTMIHSTPGFLIHPGQARPVYEFHIGFEYQQGYQGHTLREVGGLPVDDAFLEFHYQVAARDMRAWSGTYRVEADELRMIGLKEILM
jgi:hypothetical protein